MATQRQIQANRANARKSTGPRTAMVGCPFLGAAAFPGGIPVFKPQPVFQPVPHGHAATAAGPGLRDGLPQSAGRTPLSLWSMTHAIAPGLETVSRHRVRHERSYYKALHELDRLQQARAGHPVPPPQVIEIHGETPAADPPGPTPPPVTPSPRLPLSQPTSQPAQNKTDNPKLALNRKTAAINQNVAAACRGNRGNRVGGRARLGRPGPVGKTVEV